MKSFLAIIFLAAVLLATWWLFFKTDKTGPTEPKQESIKIGKHSPEFNQSVSDAISAYMSMKDAFVDADTSTAKSANEFFISKIDTLNLTDLEHEDSLVVISARQQLSDIRANAEAMLQENNITEMRQDFRMVSENLYPFLKTIGYEGEKLYWDNCPMAFGEDKEGNWLSRTKEIINPYLGKNHPEFKSSMLNCGEVKDTLQ